MRSINRPQISIIIPVGPTETLFGQLVCDLASMPPAIVEIIVVSCAGVDALTDKKAVETRLSGFNVLWIESEAGRAKQMNSGAAQAKGEFLWFLHLDSHVASDGFRQLLASLENVPQALHYFDLGWSEPSPKHMKYNAIGANFRSRWFGVPFGDQGFCLPTEIFNAAGKYNETAAYGEDHLLTWQVRQAGYRLKQVNSTLLTSPRKYQQKGWLKLTCLYQWLWIKQAIPELWRLIKLKLSRSTSC